MSFSYPIHFLSKMILLSYLIGGDPVATNASTPSHACKVPLLHHGLMHIECSWYLHYYLAVANICERSDKSGVPGPCRGLCGDKIVISQASTGSTRRRIGARSWI